MSKLLSDNLNVTNKAKWDEALDKIFDLEKWLIDNRSILKEQINNMNSIYISVYIEVLFEFDNAAYELASLYSDDLSAYCFNDVKTVTLAMKLFIRKFSKLLQFYVFAGIEEPEGLWQTFEYWKNLLYDI